MVLRWFAACTLWVNLPLHTRKFHSPCQLGTAAHGEIFLVFLLSAFWMLMLHLHLQPHLSLGSTFYRPAGHTLFASPREEHADPGGEFSEQQGMWKNQQNLLRHFLASTMAAVKLEHHSLLREPPKQRLATLRKPSDRNIHHFLKVGAPELCGDWGCLLKDECQHWERD